MKPIEYSPRDGFAAEGEESGTKFNDVDLSDDWCDFDERQNEPVGVYNLKHCFKWICDSFYEIWGKENLGVPQKAIEFVLSTKLILRDNNHWWLPLNLLYFKPHHLHAINCDDVSREREMEAEGCAVVNEHQQQQHQSSIHPPTHLSIIIHPPITD